MKKRLAIPLITLIFFTLLIAAGLVIFFATNLAEHEVNNFIASVIPDDLHLRISIDEINRSWWDRVDLYGVKVDYVTENDSVRLADIEVIKADYSLLRFFRARFILDSLTIENPTLYLKRAASGGFLVPVGGDDQKGGKENKFLPGVIFGVRNLSISSGKVVVSSPQGKETIDINISGGFQRIPPDEFEFRITDATMDYSSKDFTVELLQLKGKYLPERLEVKELQLVTGESDVKGELSVDFAESPETNFDLEGENFSFEELGRIAKPNLHGDIRYHIVGESHGGEFEGKALLDGLFYDRRFDDVNTDFHYKGKRLSFSNIDGKIFEAGLKGECWLDFSIKPEEYYVDARVNNLNLNNIAFNTLETDFNGDVKIDGRGLKPEDLLMKFDVNLGETRIETYRFDTAKGGFDLTLSDIIFQENFQAEYKHTDVQFDGRLEYTGNVDITGNAQFNDLNDFDEQIFIKDLGGTGTAHFYANGATEDFNLYGTFSSDSCQIYGIYTSSFNTALSLESFISHPQGEVRFGMDKGEIYSLPMNSADGFVVVAGDYVFIDSLKIDFENGKCWFSGRYDGAFMPADLSLDSLLVSVRGNEITNNDTLIILLNEDDIGFSQFELQTNGGTIEADGTIDEENNMDLTIDLESVDISPYISIVDYYNRWDGLLSGAVSLRGDFQQPVIRGDLSVLDFGYNFYTLGKLESKFDYSDRILEFTSLKLSDSLSVISAIGYLPIDLSFDEVTERIPDSTFSVEIEAEGDQLNIVSIFIPQIEYLFADYSANLMIDNHIFSPTFEGELELTDGILKIRDLAEAVYNLNGAINLDNKIIDIDSLRGNLEVTKQREQNIFGKIWSVFFPTDKATADIFMSGDVDISNWENFRYDLEITGRNVPIVHEVYDLTAVVDANLSIAGYSPPTVSGDISVLQAYYREPFASADNGESAKQHAVDETQWDLNLDITADNNIWVINPDMNAEFEGEINVTREEGLYRLQGDIQTIRGVYYLPPLMDFRIDEGHIMFNDPELSSFGSIDPELDVRASTRIRTTDDRGEVQGEKEINLTVKGRLSEPILNLSSPEGDSQQEILEYLTFHGSFSSPNNNQGATATFGDRAQSLFGDIIGQEIQTQTARTFGVETLEIKPSAAGKFDLRQTRVTVGKYISPSVYLKYSRKLSHTSGQEIAAEYRLNRNFSLEAKTDVHNLYRLDFNFNIEFK
ncbi:MAG: hypothetical protein GF315_13035 [candidate division Zixibacteria bacterium]|nr:hypothetical protein [candidate division Zixibacteria bacterium]